MWRPGGKAPVYLAHILLKSVAVGSAKYTKEEHGFDGFGIRLEIIKSRSNQAGQTVDIIYDKDEGKVTMNLYRKEGNYYEYVFADFGKTSVSWVDSFIRKNKLA